MKIKGLPSTKGEQPTDLERARGVGTNEPGNPSALPKRVVGAHGPAPRGLSLRERSIWWWEGWGSIESRRGVLWDREYARRLAAESTIKEEPEDSGKMDVTPTETLTDRVQHIWGIRGVPFTRAT